MKRSRSIALSALMVLLFLAGGSAANELPSVSTSTISCEVDQATKIKNLDPLVTEVFLPTQGRDLKLTALLHRFPEDPSLFGLNRVRGKGQFNYFCYDGRVQQNRGRDKDQFDAGGHAAAAQRIPANTGCQFTGAAANLIGSQKQPAGADVEFQLGLQAVAPGADPECFDLDTLCLNRDNRFKVEVGWRDFTGNSGNAVAFPRSDDSGTFFFFDPDNTELLLKVIDGCRFNDHFWVFASALTNVEYELTVTDTLTNASRVYDNPLGQPAPAITDTQAFATCP